ncbi:type IV pili system adhesin PilY [Geomonas limicola]|uniref:Type IV pili system adhesin PilY n=1 Tax=Geomonas limicola TaxID=2740186 RepID=A0A6V8N6C8_9BACT|nr:hypothetical protein [Geomonas limicola]GFO66839.1 type IV pili system adhesin PilY [Geomonas limicola]
MRKLLTLMSFGLALTLPAAPTLAAPDTYSGDSSIYGTPATLEANVLIIIDNSGSMADNIGGSTYTPSTNYDSTNSCGTNGTACSTNAVYSYNNGVYTLLNSAVSSITTSCNNKNPQSLLTTTGQYSGRTLNANGTCGSNKSGSGSYFTGNYINWLQNPDLQPRPKIDIAKEVVKNLITSTSGVKFGLMVFNYEYGSGTSSTNPNGGRLVSSSVTGAGTAKYVTEVKKMDDIFTGTITNRTALLEAVDSIDTIGNTPLASTLYEAGRYFAGAAPAFGSTVGVSTDAGGNSTYVSPMEANCQKNYVVFVTDGMANADDQSVLGTICTDAAGHPTADCDGDGKEPVSTYSYYTGYTYTYNHSLDDVAKYLNAGTQKITTFTIGYGLAASDPAVALLQRAADTSHGKGAYYSALNQMDLSAAFNKVMAQIFTVNSSYVAPVVPVSPENRTYGGSRVFMGFFKPVNGSYWIGNLKKFGIDSSNRIIDANGALATYMDMNNDQVDDNSSTALPAGAVNGSFKSTSQSFWSLSADGGDVAKGGAGEVLQGLSNITSTRKIYTVNSAGSLVAFNAANVTPDMLGYDATDTTSRNNLVNFIYGLDSYDENLNGVTSANRGWIMGDVLHSRPMVINYSSYTFNSTNETNCSTNKTMMYVGANDGMLHAIRDCDGQEVWSFIPPDLLPNLKYINSGNHVYFVDSTAAAYVYDANNNGNIESGDKVVLVFGTRRGGGSSTGPTTGSYYALDVSSASTSPTVLWRISNTSPTASGSPIFGELAETWSEPKLLRMKIGGATKIVAVLGGGYDNVNEDQRYGATQTFTGTALNLTDTGSGAVTSSGSSSPGTPKGRGLYVVEVATLNSAGVPSFTNGGSKIWGYTNADNSALAFSFPGEVAAIDSTGSGFADRLYAADTGGNIWRFDVGASSTGSWSARKLFSSNPGLGGSSDVGRKIFYKPSVVVEPGYTMIYFGTGDREHPLNTNVVDRIYALKDVGQTGTVTESSMLDVTGDELQSTTVASGTGSISDIMSKLNASTNYGWYIKLNQNSGEKVLAAPLVFSKVAYFTTYAPGAASTDVCLTGNLGTSRQYALNYLTGEAVLNYDTTNDSTLVANPRSQGPILSGSGATATFSRLLRSDRVKTTGSGIPSSVVLMIPTSGQVNILTGIGGGLASDKPKAGLISFPLYWRQR